MQATRNSSRLIRSVRYWKKMKIELEQIEGDDPKFVDALGGMIGEIVRRVRAPEVFLIRIDNWFDHKWLGFAGKVKITINTGLDEINSEVVPVGKSRSDVVFPPFVPNRILAQDHFLNEDNRLRRPEDPRFVHPVVKQRSAKNLDTKVLDFCPHGIFFWFSSQSASTRRASLMVYHTRSSKLFGWYVSFTADPAWRVAQVKNMEKEIMERIFKREG